MVTGIDLNRDWKYIQRTRCFKKGKPKANQYYCDVCNKNVANPHQTRNPDWIVDYFIDSLIANWVVLGIKIDNYNLSPTYIRSLKQTMVYSVVNIPSSLNDFDMTDYVINDKYMRSTITEDEEKMLDNLMWGQVCETKDVLHVEVQDVIAHGISVNTIVSSSFTATEDIENDASVEDAKVENYHVDEREVDEVVVSEPQVVKVYVDDA
uniref:Replication factor A protein 1 n=1 Tax=Tanacetum cinerariifolium TaxID=118510 RepID=A0A6L2LUU3_TANCI|nr:replication factor A protein 1 [Tanacetum cinerariifolium]